MVEEVGGLKMIEQAYFYLYVAVCIGLSIAALIAIIRSITTKTITGRFIGINIVTTVVLMAILVLTLLLNEGYLLDVALVYALLSCVALIVLSKIYVNLFQKEDKGGADVWNNTDVSNLSLHLVGGDIWLRISS